MIWPQLIAHIITLTVGKWAICNMYNNNECGPHKCQELCLLCHATHGVTSDPPCLPCHLVWYRVCYLPPTRQTTTMEPLVDYPRQHIKHAHLQSWLWDHPKMIINYYCRLKTIKIIHKWTMKLTNFSTMSKQSTPLDINQMWPTFRHSAQN